MFSRFLIKFYFSMYAERKRKDIIFSKVVFKFFIKILFFNVYRALSTSYAVLAYSKWS